MSAIVRINKNDKFRPVDRGQSQTYELATGITAMDAGQMAALDTDGKIKIADGTADSIIGVIGDDLEDVYGSARYPTSGSGKVTVWHGFGRYITLTYDTAATYNEGDILYCDANGKFTTNNGGGANAEVGVVALAPVVPAVVPTAVPELLKGTQYGARKEDALRTLPNGTKLNFLGVVWKG